MLRATARLSGTTARAAAPDPPSARKRRADRQRKQENVLDEDDPRWPSPWPVPEAPEYPHGCASRTNSLAAM
jgi:hypothetical protein